MEHSIEKTINHLHHLLGVVEEKSDAPGMTQIWIILIWCSPLIFLITFFILVIIVKYFTRQNRPKYICATTDQNLEFIRWANKHTKKFKPNILLPGLYPKLALVLRKRDVVQKDYYREIFVFEEDGGQIALDYYMEAWKDINDKHETMFDETNNRRSHKSSGKNTPQRGKKSSPLTPKYEDFNEDDLNSTISQPETQKIVDAILGGDKGLKDSLLQDSMSDNFLPSDINDTQPETNMTSPMKEEPQNPIHKEVNHLLLESENPHLKGILPRRPTLINPHLLDVSIDKNQDFDRAIAIVIPGLSSCSRDKYVKDTCKAINQYTEFLPIVMNRRGYSDVPVTGMYPMCKGRHQDLDSVIDYVKDRLCKTKPLIIVGLSLGGEYLQYYLGKKKELGEETYIDAAISVAALFNQSNSCQLVDNQPTLRKGIIIGALEIHNKHMENQHYMEMKERNGVSHGKTSQSQSTF